MGTIQCKHCGSLKIKRNGIKNGNQRYYCNACGREFSEKTESNNNMENALFIGDIHAPYEHKDYLEFCVEVAKRYNVTRVYCVGDIVDNHAISYHETNPRAHGASAEIEKAIEHLSGWYDAFPNMKICIGNHDALPMRKLATAGLPSEYMRSLSDVLCMPEGWEFDYSYEVDGVLVIHGTGFSGMYSHVTASRSMMRSVIMGHNHSVCGVQYTASEDKLIFGMNVGCGIDRHSFAFSYGLTFPRKPILSVGLLLNGRTPIIETMEMK